MPMLYRYSTPPAAAMTLTLDTGQAITGIPCEHAGRTDAHRFELPKGTASQGARLEVTCAGYGPFAGRGALNMTVNPPTFDVDDIHLAIWPSPETPPAPVYPTGTPEQIIDQVYAAGGFDLSTKTGCGQFTEACCDALHASDPMWGHFKKNPGQNRYPDPPAEGKNAHAVDAVQCLAGQYAGGWDIIHDSVSENASPCFNLAGSPAPELWYYPA